MLEDYLISHEQPHITPVPIVSGAIGYFSYDYGRQRLGIRSKNPSIVQIPDAPWIFHDVFIIEDLRTHEVWLITNGLTRPAGLMMDWLIQEIIRRKEHLSSAPCRQSVPESCEIRPFYTRQE